MNAARIIDAAASVRELHDVAMQQVDDALSAKDRRDARFYWTCALTNELQAALDALQRETSDATVLILVNSAQDIARGWHAAAAVSAPVSSAGVSRSRR